MSRTSKMDYGIVFQSGFRGVTGHVDVFYNGYSGGGAYSYFTNANHEYNTVKTYFWRR